MCGGHRSLVAMAVLLLRSVAASQSTYCGETKGTATASYSLQVPAEMWNAPGGPPIIRSLDFLLTQASSLSDLPAEPPAHGRSRTEEPTFWRRRVPSIRRRKQSRSGVYEWHREPPFVQSF